MANGTSAANQREYQKIRKRANQPQDEQGSGEDMDEFSAHGDSIQPRWAKKSSRRNSIKATANVMIRARNGIHVISIDKNRIYLLNTFVRMYTGN